jgi:tetratricopeptide (TPR) repeat protein
LQNFVIVCKTMAYAHSKQVIHRDLKPANVMLGKYGETLVVDWGLAKEVRPDAQPQEEEQTLAETTVDCPSPAPDQRLYTQAGQALGTPAFMSPEQAAGHWEVVGPASDIYSLGAILYVILTGQLPLQSGSWPELQQKIQRGEVTPPQRIKPDTPRPLAAVCSKAMAVKPEDRYGTAADLAIDVEQWLADEPVTAWGEPWSIRCGRWMRKHRTLVTSAAALLVTAVVGLSIGLVAVDSERRQTELEREATAHERDEKAKALDAESKARDREQKAREQAMAALRDMSTELVQNQLAQATHLTEENKEFLRSILKHYENFAALSGDDATSRSIRAEGYGNVGTLRYRLGELKEAESAYGEALKILQKLATDFPDRPQFRYYTSLRQIMRGQLLRDTGRLKEAESAYSDALAIDKRLVTEFPNRTEFRQGLANSHSSLGALFRATGRPKEAESAFGEVLRIEKQLVADSPNNPEFREHLINSYINLGVILTDTGRLKEAEAGYVEALALKEQLADEITRRPDFRHSLAAVYQNLGHVRHASGRLAEADAALANVVTIRRQLADEFPTRAEFRRELAGALYSRGHLFFYNGRLKEAESAYGDALALQKQLAADFPMRQQYRRELALSYHTLGAMFAMTGRPAEAEAAMVEGVAVFKRLVAEFPTWFEYRRDLARAQHNLASLLKDTGRLDDSETNYREVIVLQKELATDLPSQPELRHELAMTLNNLGKLLLRRGRIDEASATYTSALELCQRLVAEFPVHAEFRQELSAAHNNLGNALRLAGHFPEAVAAYRKALELEKQLAEQFPNMPLRRNDVAGTLGNLANVAVQQRDFALARTLLVEAMPHHQAVLQNNPQHPEYQKFYRNNLAYLVLACAGQGDRAAALEAAKKRRDLGWDAVADAYDAACALGHCALIVEEDDKLDGPKRQAEAEFYADASMAMLRDAVAKGYKDIEHLKKDDDLKPLRNREDYKKLLKELETGKP